MKMEERHSMEETHSVEERQYLTFALAKGRLANQTLALFEEMGSHKSTVPTNITARRLRVRVLAGLGCFAFLAIIGILHHSFCSIIYCAYLLSVFFR